MLREAKVVGRGLLRRLVQPILDSASDPSAIHANPYVTGKLYPVSRKSLGHVQLYPNAFFRPDGEEFPVPPKNLWEGYASTPEAYLECGRQDIATLSTILSKANVCPQDLTRVLDFGCAAGRMLRFYPRQEKSELWGVDINAAYINWCQLNLSPPLSFATTTTAPHLPFEDGYFDLIYSGSVFTHISELADAWFLELRRVVRKGGYLYITIHDRRTIELLLTKYKNHPLFGEFVDLVQGFQEQTGVLSKEYAYFTILNDPISQVFYDENYLIRKWSQWTQVVSITPEAHDHQTALLLCK